MRILKRKRPRVRVLSARKAEDANGERLYEIGPESYAGPWTLEPGTVLEVVSTPKTGENAGWEESP